MLKQSAVTAVNRALANETFNYANTLLTNQLVMFNMTIQHINPALKSINPSGNAARMASTKAIVTAKVVTATKRVFFGSFTSVVAVTISGSPDSTSTAHVVL